LVQPPNIGWKKQAGKSRVPIKLAQWKKEDGLGESPLESTTWGSNEELRI